MNPQSGRRAPARAGGTSRTAQACSQTMVSRLRTTFFETSAPPIWPKGRLNPLVWLPFTFSLSSKNVTRANTNRLGLPFGFTSNRVPSKTYPHSSYGSGIAPTIVGGHESPCKSKDSCHRFMADSQGLVFPPRIPGKLSPVDSHRREGIHIQFTRSWNILRGTRQIDVSVVQ